MESASRKQSFGMDASSRDNDEPALAQDETIPLSSRQLQGPPATSGSKNFGSVSRRYGFIQEKFQRISQHWDPYKSKPWNMCLLVVFGFLFALGHHLFCLRLDGEWATGRSTVLRYGTLLAFCTKACLGAAAVMAFQQRVWLVLRHKSTDIKTIDSMFTANNDIFSLLTWSSVKTAKISTLIAIYCWLTPLVVVLTSETIFVVDKMTEEIGKCSRISTLNFENENFGARPTPRRYDHISTLSAWNTTAIGNETNPDDPNEFYYWGGPSQRLLDKIDPRVALTDQSRLQQIGCHSDSCSYEVSFVAPSYECEKLAYGINSTVKSFGGSTPPFNTSILAPVGDMIYYARTDLGEYMDHQILSGPGGRPEQRPPYPKNLGAFRTEPIMWIGYSRVRDVTAVLPKDRGDPRWYEAYTPEIIGCEHYLSNYTVEINYTNPSNVQKYHRVLARSKLRKVINTTLTSDLDPDERLKDRTKAVPESNYIRPSDVDLYGETAAYHSLGYIIRRIFNGTITMLPNYNVNSRIATTDLVDDFTYLPIVYYQDDLGKHIRKMYENILIALLEDKYFKVTSWAANGLPVLTAQKLDLEYPCLQRQYNNVFEYNRTQLLLVYTASIALAIAAVLLGLQAYREAGTMLDMKPSSIIAASGAQEFHKLGTEGRVRIGNSLVQDGNRSRRSLDVEENRTQPQSSETE